MHLHIVKIDLQCNTVCTHKIKSLVLYDTRIAAKPVHIK